MEVFDPLKSKFTSQLLSSIGEKLYLNSELSDVHFVFESNGDNERVPALKSHLMAASDVFATMFNESWKEKDEVIIVDAPAAAFKEFLQFFYLEEVKLTMENVAVVMNLGEKYNVTECLTVCSKFVKNNLNDDNVCRYYGLAILLDQEDLKQSCETFIGFNTNAVFNTSDFLSCNKKVLAEILKLNWLSCTEIDLFEACMSWIKATSKQNELTKEIVQAQLGEHLYEFRFRSMSFQEFAKLTKTYEQIFTVSEFATIIQMFADQEIETTMFNENREKRCDSYLCTNKDKIFCNRLHSKYNSTVPYFIKNVETTKFSVDQPLLLKGFTFDFIRKHFDGQYIICEDVPVELDIVEVSGFGDSKKEVVKYNGKSKLSSLNCENIELDKPVLIRPGFMYEIRLKQNPPENCAIGILLESEVKIKSDITIQFHDDPLIPDDCAATGLIYKLYFYQIGEKKK